MAVRIFRTMQGRPVTFVIGLWLVLATVFFIYFHFGEEVSRLQATNKKLEHALSRLQQGGGGVELFRGRTGSNLDLSVGENVASAGSAAAAFYSSPSMDEVLDNLVVIYNRVPKTGSTSFMGVAYDLCIKNHFNVLHINTTKNIHVLSLSDQSRFAYNSTFWSAKKPALYHGHIAFVDFSRFGISQKPIFINIIRKPLDRLVSYYYFLRYGDDFRPYLVRRRQGDKMTFDECVEQQEADCASENMWMQIPFFCGHMAECWIPGNEWALQQAKHNLVQHYLLVGVTEELQDFVTLLEGALPRFFQGAAELFAKGKKSHLRKTTNKIEPSPETVMRIQQSSIWKMENEFYEFALEHFHFIKKRTLTFKDGVLTDKGQQFLYEKIRPK